MGSTGWQPIVFGKFAAAGVGRLKAVEKFHLYSRCSGAKDWGGYGCKSQAPNQRGGVVALALDRGI